MTVEKVTNRILDMATEEKDKEKKELFNTAGQGLTALLSIEPTIKEQIDDITCNNKEHQKWFRLGELYILNVIQTLMQDMGLDI